jgi:hypothetical protein
MAVSIKQNLFLQAENNPPFPLEPIGMNAADTETAASEGTPFFNKKLRARA